MAQITNTMFRQGLFFFLSEIDLIWFGSRTGLGSEGGGGEANF
jgi:hypothetical protein